MKQRLSYVYWRTWPGILLSPGLALVGAITATQVTQGPPWIMWAWTAFALGLGLGWALVEYLRGGARRQVGPLEVVAHPGTQVDLDVWAEWYERQWWQRRWRATARRRGWDRGVLHGDATVEFVARKPTLPYYDTDDDSEIPDVDDSREGIQTHGQHWPDERRIVVHAPEAEGPVCLHELDLLAAHRIWPGQSESEDIDSLKDVGVR